MRVFEERLDESTTKRLDYDFNCNIRKISPVRLGIKDTTREYYISPSSDEFVKKVAILVNTANPLKDSLYSLYRDLTPLHDKFTFLHDLPDELVIKMTLDDFFEVSKMLVKSLKDISLEDFEKKINSGAIDKLLKDKNFNYVEYGIYQSSSPKPRPLEKQIGIKECAPQMHPPIDNPREVVVNSKSTSMSAYGRELGGDYFDYNIATPNLDTKDNPSM